MIPIPDKNDNLLQNIEDLFPEPRSVNEQGFIENATLCIKLKHTLNNIKMIPIPDKNIEDLFPEPRSANEQSFTTLCIKLKHKLNIN